MESVLGFILSYRYFALFPLAIIEGPIVAFAGGVLIALGILSPLPTFILLVLGDVLPDMAYYLFGIYGTNTTIMQRYLMRNKNAAAHLDAYERLWRVSPLRMMVMSKLAYGLSTLLLVSAGMVKVPIGKFFRQALAVTLLQYGILMYLGMHFGNALATTDKYFSYIGYAVAIIVVVFLVGFIAIKRYAKNALERASDTPPV
jgi:membrane protein DedA with SNARE-associated domain